MKHLLKQNAATKLKALQELIELVGGRAWQIYYSPRRSVIGYRSTLDARVQGALDDEVTNV
jgi:hypothetical protein